MADKEIEKSYAEHQHTSKEVGLALVSNNFDNSLDYAEIGLDAFVSDGILKEIPIVKTVVGVVKSGLKVKEIFFAKKILTFLREQIMLFNDAFLQVEKSKIFANLFAAHLNEAYAWDDFINLTLCLNQLNMYAASLFDDMSKFRVPFHGAIYDDTKQLFPLLINSGTISVWGNHLDITGYGLFLYHYGIQGKTSEDIRDTHASLFKTDEQKD
jgi:hypothetical protein